MNASRKKVWVTQPVFPDIVARLESDFDLVQAHAVTRYTSAELAAGLRDVDGAIVCIPDRIDAAAIAGATRLKAIANIGTGYNNLDIAALTAAGIVATNTPDVLTETTADFAWALLLATARRVTEAERWLREGHWTTWSFELMLGQDIHGSTLGILGMGRIGQAIARRAAGFRMRVLYYIVRGCPLRSSATAMRTTWTRMNCSRRATIWCSHRPTTQAIITPSAPPSLRA
ncbi:NAD(P)-dependent oxidoreductase [Dokdonella soli]|uniref:D-isomer specific 2-hydroxyacid dehydrogenase catalytic domain-containing protein n=1 Tax=Dokdonella soli TaxID=529810 RepID=A0ABP3U2J4_9GAMM